MKILLLILFSFLKDGVNSEEKKGGISTEEDGNAENDDDLVHQEKPESFLGELQQHFEDWAHDLIIPQNGTFQRDLYDTIKNNFKYIKLFLKIIRGGMRVLYTEIRELVIQEIPLALGMENTSKQFGVEDEKEKTADSEEHWWGG
ncbi:uncharacterized protein LOC111713309 [Eurytemora carolleeae]|uniref:uncharacterized protein LOC111713309 n=1 Tax=Eurytemora carolleeae TaxID=1294199 RepID=UPI000C788395|nr:uncharacterized protein LOC111713309 [Eurytemora carolleeae]|eukprot:XP_023343914.1 uncharacterized protein LOC111713309 [Eurytemora affinis]